MLFPWKTKIAFKYHSLQCVSLFNYSYATFPRILFSFNNNWVEQIRLENKKSQNVETFKKQFYHSLGHLLIAHSTVITLKKFMSHLNFDLSHLREHKFVSSFQDFLNSCNCEKGRVEISFHYPLYCSNYLKKQLALLNTIKMLCYNKVIRNLLALCFLAKLLLTITKILLSFMPL